ncbi:DUF4145 domain-containing protein [Herbiconiux liukaitaii]|uniref:DUF4145 domain-containing protein n=1 Tax=Herbiconiux liukaitaii TaxID=3342799 RepID=UPI0035B7A2D3
MLSGTCAFCGNQTHFTARAGRVNSLDLVQQTSRHSYRLEISATCDACQRFNSAYGVSRVADRRLVNGSMLSGSDVVTEGEAMSIDSWSPPPMRPVDTAFIPDGVAGFYKEAHDAFSIGAYRGVLLLVRSVIEATAKDRGVGTGTLVQKINKLFDEGHVRRGTKDMAHALRILGNDMAHGDIDDIPTQEDADDALTIARFVLDDVYVADARRADMMARRQPPEA